MQDVERLLENNKNWCAEKLAADPEFFKALAHNQEPNFLWIGCSDSRVPAEYITGAEPGELFVHRNVANLVISTDYNLLAVLQYAVNVLKVKHIIVCGHYNCGGIRAAMQKTDLGEINNWLQPIKNIYRLYEKELESFPTEQERIRRLVELNVVEQTRHLSYYSLIQRAWHEENRPILHGWVYDIGKGLINPICRLKPGYTDIDINTYNF